jgi:hypothetical protein
VQALRTDPKALEDLLTAMPKGADLHNHRPSWTPSEVT